MDTHGKKDEYMGSMKEKLGSAVGSENLQNKGRAERQEGEATRTSYETKQHMEAQRNEGVGYVKEGTGEALGNQDLKHEGQSQRAKSNFEEPIHTRIP